MHRDPRKPSRSLPPVNRLTPAPAAPSERSASVRSAPARSGALARVRGMRDRVPKSLRIVVYVVVGTFLFYLLAANIILSTRLLRGWLSHDEKELKVDYRSAWSLYPGHVAVRELSVRYSDSNIQMLIRLEKATLHLDPFALTKKAVRLSKLDGDGATFLLRTKVESVEGSEERIRAFPNIDGFDSPPIEKKVPKPPIPDDQYKLWTIELTDVSASLREVWIMEYRYRGEGSLSGGFHLKPKRELWVMPSVMLTRGGTLSLGDRDLIRGGEGRLDAQIDPYDVREPKGIEVLRNLTARAHQRGELVTPSIAQTYLPKESSVVVEQGTGPIAIDVNIDHGILQPDTRVTFHADAIVVKDAPASVRSDLDIDAHVDASGAKPRVIFDTKIAHAAVTPSLDVRGAHATLDLGNADLTAPFVIARLSGAVTSAHAADLRAWQPFAPEKSSFDGGAATAAARADYHDGALEGRVDLALDKARMTFGTFSFATSGKAWTNVASEDLEKAVAFPGTGVDLHDMALRLQSGHTEGLWMKSRFDHAVATTSGALGFDTDIAVDSGPGDRTAQLFTRMASLPDLTADATSGTQLAASLHLRVRPGDVSLAVLKAKNGAIESRGRLRKRAKSEMTGAFLVSAGPIHFGLDLHDGGVSVMPFAGGGWLDEKLQKR
jgi:hypothetical protein